MKKMSINDAAEHFSISREAIHNRIRRGSLESIIENGLKMVLVDENAKARAPRVTNKTNQNITNDRYYKLLEEQNAKLQARVELLEGETRTLRDQKELMLIQEREKIEEIYKEKDEQLKNILATLSSQFLLNTPQEEESELLEAEIEEVPRPNSKPISLNKYLKLHNISDKKKKKIKAYFEKKEKKEERIILKGSKYYVDTSLYNYSDLIGK